MTPHGHTKAQARVLVAALFETAQSGQAPRFPSAGAGRKAVVHPSSGAPLGSTQKQPVIPRNEGEELTDLPWMGRGRSWEAAPGGALETTQARREGLGQWVPGAGGGAGVRHREGPHEGGLCPA